jgi:hypothetical protein
MLIGVRIMKKNLILILLTLTGCMTIKTQKFDYSNPSQVIAFAETFIANNEIKVNIDLNEGPPKNPSFWDPEKVLHLDLTMKDLSLYSLRYRQFSDKYAILTYLINSTLHKGKMKNDKEIVNFRAIEIRVYPSGKVKYKPNYLHFPAEHWDY